MDRSSSIFPQIYIFFAPTVYISASEMKFSVNELGVSHKKIIQGDVSMAINFNYLNPFATFIIFLVGQALYLVTLNRISFQYGNGVEGVPIVEHSTNTTTHYNDVIMDAMASQITGVTNVYSIVCSGTDRRKHQISAPLAFVIGIPVNSPHNRPVTRKCFHLMTSS